MIQNPPYPYMSEGRTLENTDVFSSFNRFHGSFHTVTIANFQQKETQENNF